MMFDVKISNYAINNSKCLEALPANSLNKLKKNIFKTTCLDITSMVVFFARCILLLIIFFTRRGIHLVHVCKCFTYYLFNFRKILRDVN